LGQLQKISAQIAELGYQVIAVSPDRPEKIRAVLEKSPYDYRLLSDTKLAVALAMGVAFTMDAKTVEKYKGYGFDLEDASGEAHHMLPVPAVFVLDTSGGIRYVYANPDYKVRCDPDVILAEAKKALD
jgi:peroxiredoxin